MQNFYGMFIPLEVLVPLPTFKIMSGAFIKILIAKIFINSTIICTTESVLFIIVFIKITNVDLFHTVMLKIVDYPRSQILDIAEVVFISFFLSEMCLKLYGLGPRMYFKSQFNTFDCVVSIDITPSY